MENEIKDIILNCNREDDIKFSKSFKMTLGLGIALTGTVSITGIFFMISGFATRVWESKGVNFYFVQSLFIFTIIAIFIALVSIALTRKPFSKIIVGCFMAIGIIFVLASFILPHIHGYINTGFVILSDGDFTLIDGTILMIGIVGILFSKIIHYGFLYQRNSDLIV